MEIKKEEKKIEEKKENFANVIDNASQKLIKSFHESNQKKDPNLIAKALDDVTKHEFPKLQQLYNEKCEQYKEKNKSIEELTDTLKRLQAEFENYKKWNAKEKTEFVKYAHADIVEKILPVLDSFEIALKNTSDKEKFVEGIKMIYAQFYSILEAEGIKPIKAIGEKFDHYKHEVLTKEESDKPEDTILEEFQKGYMLNNRVIRHSKVKISGK